MDREAPGHPAERRAPRSPWDGRIWSAGDAPASIANIANIVTVVRILLAPVFVWLLLAEGGRPGALRYAAAALFIVAIVTDSLDGHLARSRNLITDLGIILDPIADKILIGGALIGLSILGDVPWWMTVLVLVREFGITIFRFAVLSERVIPASRGGKLKTVLQAVAVALFLIQPWSFLGAWAGWVCWVLLGAAVLLTVTSGIEYLAAAWRGDRDG